MKDEKLEDFIIERIYENKEMFSKNELTKIDENIILIKKIYILALKNANNILLD